MTYIPEDISLPADTSGNTMRRILFARDAHPLRDIERRAPDARHGRDECRRADDDG